MNELAFSITSNTTTRNDGTQYSFALAHVKMDVELPCRLQSICGLASTIPLLFVPANRVWSSRSFLVQG